MSDISKWARFVRTFISVLIAGTIAPRDASANEEAEWTQARQLSTSEAYFRYLRRNPEGAHIEDAVRALKDLGALGSAGSSRSRGVKLY